MKIRLLSAAALVLLLFYTDADFAAAHRVYLMNDNHTDYGWNATTDAYDASMLSELDFYLDEVDRTSSNPPAEQARFNADSWWYLYLYEKNRTPQQFQRLIDAMRSGHITIPLNPFVTLYGAIPTEAAIRAGYYPGRIERQYGVPFRIAQNIENHTNPWGLSSLWAGSGIDYTWKGVCGCATDAPFGDRTEEVFRWQGPDDKELLMKWYQIEGSNQSWGGYSEARANLSQNGIQAAIDRFSNRAPFLPITGLFGAGWDNVNWESTTLVDAAQQWNAVNVQDEAIVSNGIDYFEELENFRNQLPILRGGWGNDWDLWSVALAEPTATTRRTVERLRSAEYLGVLAQWADKNYWAPVQRDIEAGFTEYFKYFEHGWDTTGGIPLQSLVDNKFLWSDNFSNTVTTAKDAASSAVSSLFTTPNEDRFVVFNHLSFERTDVADLPWSNMAPVRVIDLATGTEVASQRISRDGQSYIRILATNVPSLGYRTYRIEGANPAILPDAATIAGATIENGRYRVEVGSRGQIISCVDKLASKELAGPGGLNDFGSGVAGGPVSENVGPISATLLVDVAGTPPRRMRVTLFKDIDRIEIEDEILDNITSVQHYRFDVGLTAPQIRFEEIGAIAKPGFSMQGGDFLPGTRAEYMTLNHFVSFEENNYTIVLSNWDASFMKIGQSTRTVFDLPSAEVNVLAVGNPLGYGIQNQGGKDFFLHRFAVSGSSGSYSSADAMRTSLTHQNPLAAIQLPRNQVGSLSRHVLTLLSMDVDNVLAMAFKPAEEPQRGMVLRLWELDGLVTTVNIDLSSFRPVEAAEVSLIETDISPLTVSNSKVAISMGANEMKALRFTPTPLTDASLSPQPLSGSGGGCFIKTAVYGLLRGSGSPDE